MVFPEVPQLLHIAFQLRHLDAAAFQRGGGAAVVVLGGEGQEFDQRRRNVQVLHRLIDQQAGRHGADPAAHEAGHRVEHALVDAHRHARRLGGAGDDVHHLTQVVAAVGGEVEALAVAFLLVGDVIQRVGHEVHRHDVEVAALHADQRDPVGQEVLELLNQLEEVVGAVDLVHLAGLGVADHQRRPVDPPGDAAFLAHQGFRFVLGEQVGVVQFAGFLEHVLAEGALVKPGGGHGRHMVERLGVDLLGQFQRLPGALDVDVALGVFIGAQVIDGGEMEEVVDLAHQIVLVALADTEQLLGQVPGDRHQTALFHAQPPAHGVQLVFRTGPHQCEHPGTFALEQTRHQEAANETGRAGNEVVHAKTPLLSSLVATAEPAPGIVLEYGDRLIMRRQRLKGQC